METKKYIVLAADDETELLDALELYLERENIALLKAKDGVEALALFRQSTVHLVILDIMMPGMDGFAVLRRIRQESHVPAIMFTARNQDYERILGLELGADDYITKPYNPLEVVARVKAQLRRNYDYGVTPRMEDTILQQGNVIMRLQDGIVEKDGQRILLTATEYKILQLFMEHPGRIFTRQQIFEQVWNEAYVADDNTVTVHISNLRNKLGEDDPQAPMIRTIKGLGYRLEKEKK